MRFGWIPEPITNSGTAALIEGFAGIKLTAGGTVTNAGTIASNQGTTGVAIVFGTGTSRLIVDPGAVFTGRVTATSTTTTSTLELASAASAGTLSGLGSQFAGFQAITVDAGAAWSLTSDNLASGYTITNAGTLTNTGTLRSAVTLGSSAVLTNASGGAITVTGNAVLGPPAPAARPRWMNAGSIWGLAREGSASFSPPLPAAGLSPTAGGVVTGGSAGVRAIPSSGAATISNYGTILGVGTASFAGVDLLGGGSVTNALGGKITGGADGIVIAGGTSGSVQQRR